MANIHPYTGQTIRATVGDLTDAAGEALASATVVVTVTDPDGDTTTPTVSQDGETYYAEFTSSVVGKHLITVTATGGGGTWRDEAQVQVYAFG